MPEKSARSGIYCVQYELTHFAPADFDIFFYLSKIRPSQGIKTEATGVRFLGMKVRTLNVFYQLFFPVWSHISLRYKTSKSKNIENRPVLPPHTLESCFLCVSPPYFIFYLFVYLYSPVSCNVFA